MPQNSIINERGLVGLQSCMEGRGARKPCRSDFLRALFHSFDELAISYCVLALENTPDDRRADPIRIVMSGSDKPRLSAAVRTLHHGGYGLPECRCEAPERYRLTFLWLYSNAIDCAQLEFRFAQYMAARKVIFAEELLSERQKKGEVWVSSVAGEFTLLLAAATESGHISALNLHRLQELYRDLDRNESRRILERLFGPRLGKKVIESCEKGLLADALPSLRKQLWLRSLIRHPLGGSRYIARKLLRSARDQFRSSGAVIVLLGPDGVGKSTLVAFLSQAFRPLFSMQRLYHWRPGVIGGSKLEGQPTEPHSSPLRGRFGSVAFLFAFFLDNVLGFFLQIWPFVTRGGLVIFDRFFPDLLVDSSRYRYGGPGWLARLLNRFVPPREKLVLVLEASEEAILSRKRELSSAELTRQRDAYRRIALSDSECTKVLFADRGLDVVQGEALRSVVDYLVRRSHQKYGFAQPSPMKPGSF